MIKRVLAAALLCSSQVGLSTELHTLADMTSLVESGDVGAASVAFLNGKQLEFHNLGMIPGASQPPSDLSIYEIGSVSKVFTALMALELQQRGNLSLDTTLGQVFPEADFDQEEVAAISLVELLTHRSGLPRMPDNFDPADALDPFADYDLDALLEFFEDFDELGSKQMAYSNLGMGLVGTAVAQSMTVDYSAALEQLLTQPLGMSDTVLDLSPAQAGRLVPGYWEGARMPNWQFNVLAGAGAIRSTARDMARFVQAQLEPSDSALAPAIDLMQRPHGNPEMGLGWLLRHSPDGDRSVLWHNGATGGYSSFVGIDVEGQRAVIVLSASAAHDAVTRAGFRFFVDENEPIRPAATDLRDLVGTYQMGEQGLVIQVTEKRGQLYAQLSGQSKFPVFPADEQDRFDYRAVEASLSFQCDDGEVLSVTLHQGGRDMLAKRVGDEFALDRFVAVDIDPTTLDEYVGDYDLNWFVTITITAREGQLFAQLSKQSPMPVFAYGDDKFFYKAVDAQLHFVRNDEGVVEAVELHQNGIQRADKD